MSDHEGPCQGTVSQNLSRAVAASLHCQWRLLDVQYGAGLKLLETLLPARPEPARAREGQAGPPLSPHELKELERQALACARRGVALPRAVYDAQNRRRIDWSGFPEWARPVDPDVFTGCTHEG